MDGTVPRRSSNKYFMTSKERRSSNSWTTHEEEVVDEWTHPQLRGRVITISQL